VPVGVVDTSRKQALEPFVVLSIGRLRTEDTLQLAVVDCDGEVGSLVVGGEEEAVLAGDLLAELEREVA